MHRFNPSRRHFLTASAGAALASLTPSLGRACPPPPPPDPLRLPKAAAAATNAFAADLYSHLAGRGSKEKGNLVVSPFSIGSVLAMTSAGARGKTLEEMEKVLHLPPEPHAAFHALTHHLTGGRAEIKRPYQLTVANAIWAQTGFPWEKAFLELTREHYGAGTIEVDFAESEAARKRINEWVAKETNQKIKELIAEGIITRLTRMVLANAIHFKGDWQYQFDKKLTADAPFTRDDGTKADVPLMTQTGTFNYREVRMFVKRRGETVQVLELPFAGKELSMLVFLPDDTSGVHRLAQWLTPDFLGAADLKPTALKVSLPRFTAESFLSLKPVLMDMGMNAAFGAADFTGMSPKGKELFITHVLHKAFVEVNEEGAEAAAATAVIIGRKADAGPKEFRADRPFVYAIRDNATRAVLFMGRYLGPAK
jgi:serpin B